MADFDNSYVKRGNNHIYCSSSQSERGVHSASNQRLGYIVITPLFNHSNTISHCVCSSARPCITHDYTEIQKDRAFQRQNTFLERSGIWDTFFTINRNLSLKINIISGDSTKYTVKKKLLLFRYSWTAYVVCPLPE